MFSATRTTMDKLVTRKIWNAVLHLLTPHVDVAMVGKRPRNKVLSIYQYSLAPEY
jgi:hypothetical protein